MELVIRNELPQDYAYVENMVREAFWNLHIPGCDEHYLVHILRNHEDFISELDLVAELDGKIVGNVMYTKAWLTDEAGNEKEILTFGPIAVHPDYQRKGIGKAMLEFSFRKALELGYDAIVIMGNPGNYVGRGFVSSHKHKISLEGGFYPTAMMVKELKPGVFDGRRWTYRESEAYNVDTAAAAQYDQQFPPKEKKHQLSQEEFYIYSHSSVSD